MIPRTQPENPPKVEEEDNAPEPEELVEEPVKLSKPVEVGGSKDSGGIRAKSAFSKPKVITTKKRRKERVSG